MIFPSMQVLVHGWRVEVAPAPPGVPPGAHELTHVVQQGRGVRAWLVRQPGTARARVPAVKMDVITTPSGHGTVAPEVGDEVLIAFEHADLRTVSVYFNPKEFTISKSSPWQVNLGAARRGWLRAVVRQRGPGGLGMSLLASAGPTERWTAIL
jgi:hypothetical protein